MLSVLLGSGKLMSKKPITVYWSPAFNIDNQTKEDWSFLYLKPKSLYKEIQETRLDSAPAGNLLACLGLWSKEITAFTNF